MAAQPEPHNIPKIVEVLDPSANQHAVAVLMPTNLASKWPSKPWGTSIASIGLATKDSDLYEDYVLVDIEAVKGSSDLYWIFQKLSGPEWTTTKVGAENIIPEKFRAQVTMTKTEQEVAPGTTPTAITGDLISSTVEDKNNTGISVKTNISEVILPDATALVSPSLEDQLYVTTEILVAEGSQPDKGAGVVESVVQAIGKGKAIKTSKFAVLSYTNKTTWTVGYATLLDFTEGSADSIPAKFRALKSLKTWRYRVQSENPPTTPALGTGTGAYAGYDIVERATKQTQENGTTDVFQVIVVGIANTGANSLDSAEYGKIVSTTSTETLDITANLPTETGIGIISSVTEELGNGLSVRKTEQVAGGAWPSTVEQDIGIESTNKPPARYLRDLTRATATSKVGSVPGSVSLGAGEVARIYKKETDTRTDLSVTTESLNLNVDAIDEAVEQKPFVQITSVMTPGYVKVSPVNRNGSSKLVYENGATEIWENTEEIAVAREGPAGQDKDVKPFVTILNNKRYSISNEINTLTGSADVIFNDGTTMVYQVTETESTGRFGPAGTEQQSKAFVSIAIASSYESTGTMGSNEVGSSNKIYDDGTTIVYEKKVETATVREGPAGQEKDLKPFVSIQTDKRYSATPDIATLTGSANVVFNDGTVQVYEISEVNSTGRYGSAGAEQQVKPFVKITSAKTYQADGTLADGEVGGSNKLYDDGTTVVYEKSVETAVVRPGPAGLDKDIKPFVEITTNKRYSATPDIATTTGSAQVIFNDGAVQAYEVSEPVSIARPGEKSTEQDSQPWGFLIEKTDYTEGSNPGDGGGSRLIYDDGTVKMYESSRVDSLVADGTTTEKDPQQWGTLRYNGSFSTAEDTDADRSKQVFRRGSFKVFLNETASLSVSGGTVDVDPKEWGDLQWDETYGTDQVTGAGKRSRQVFRLGPHVVYLNGTPTLNVIGDPFVSAREENSLLTEVQTSSYSFTSNEGVNTRSRVIFALGAQRVYENITIVRTAKATRTYPSVVNVDLPPVHAGTQSQTYQRKDGQFKVLYIPRMIAGYRGPMACTVSEYWQQDPNISVEPTVFRPEPVSFDFPAGGGYSLGVCLHGFLSETQTINPGHPVYYPSTDTIEHAATEPATWAGMEILAHVDSQPYRDGFVIREYRVQL